MAWSSDFLDALQRPPYHPRFEVEVFKPRFGTYPGGEGVFDGDMVANVRTQASTLTPITWTHTPGGFTFDILSESLFRWRAVAVRGSLVKLRVGFRGERGLATAVVAIGRVFGMQTVGKRCTVSCLDLTAALMNRPVASAAGLGLKLFGNAGASTILTTDYTAGDPTIDVGDTSIFLKETGGNGLLRITPNSGDPFYLTWSSIPFAGRINVNTTAQLGTSMGFASLVNKVEHIPYIKGHPIDTARKILASTGAGTNGPMDTLPAGWGYGLDTALIDHSDCDAYKAKVVAPSGNYTWEVFTDVPIDNGTSWLQGLLNPAGMWLGTWRGQMTVRAAIPAYGSFALVHPQQITDDDLVNKMGLRPVLHDTDPAQAAVYHRTRVTGGAGTTDKRDAATAPSFPTAFLKLHTLPYVWSNDVAIVAGDRGRLFTWNSVAPERLAGVRCAGFRLAGLGVGGLYKGISSRRLAGRLEAAGQTFFERTALVVSHRVDWAGCGVDVEFSLPPRPPDHIP